MALTTEEAHSILKGFIQTLAQIDPAFGEYQLEAMTGATPEGEEAAVEMEVAEDVEMTTDKPGEPDDQEMASKKRTKDPVMFNDDTTDMTDAEVIKGFLAQQGV